MARTIGAIDIGTNSLHLMVAEVQQDGSFRIVTREKEPVRLGSGGGDMKQLSAEAMERGVACLSRFRHIADQWGAEVTAMATSAVREADNREEFLRLARQHAGVEVEIITGTEEARLIHLGVLQAIEVRDRSHLIVDIGGGSTEFIVGHGTTPVLLRSMKLGAIRLTDRFFPGGITDTKSIARCRKYVRGFLSPLVRAISELDPEIAIASSGTAEAIALLAGSAEHLSADDLSDVTASIVEVRKPQDRVTKLGVEDRRSDIIVGGAILFEEITLALGVETWQISELALRDGIVFDLCHRDRSDQGLHRLSDIRRQSVLTVMRRYEQDIDHAEHITDLTLELFDAIQSLHGLRANDRDLLEAAALMHNIGLYVAHSAHHRHSYYLIRNSEQLAGFTDRETELIAQVARYHRKSSPKSKHREWSTLDPDDQQRVRTLAAVLRVGIGLDRGDRTIVHSVEVDISAKKVKIRVQINPGVDPDLEIYSAVARSKLLAEVIGRTVEVLADPEVALAK